MNLESESSGEIAKKPQAESPETETVAKLLKKQDKRIKDRAQDYLARLPRSSLFNPRGFGGFYRQANNADKRLENDLKRHIWKISYDEKLITGKAMLIRGICAETISELNRGITKVHPNSQQFIGQLERRIIMFGTEISNKHFRDQQGNPQIIDRDWIREFAMDLHSLKYTYRLEEMEDKLRQYVDNPPTQPVE